MRSAIAAGLLAFAAAANAEVAFEVTQTPSPPWRPGTHVAVDVRVRNLGAAAGPVEFAFFPIPQGQPVPSVFYGVRPVVPACAPGSMGAINEPPYDTWQLGSLPAGAISTCTLRFVVRDDATPGSAQWAFTALTQTLGTFVEPTYVILPFGIAPAPASVPALSWWSALLLAATALALAVLTRTRL